MKTFAERHPGEKPLRGFLAPCSYCGEVVVHSHKHMQPFHMHRRSRKCREKGAQLKMFKEKP